MHPLEYKIDYQFKNQLLLRQSLVHKSYSNESKSNEPNNEKLEFLGDAVLDLLLAEMLMKEFSNDTEGGLSKKRASLVNEDILAELSVQVGIPEFLLLGKGEKLTQGQKKPRLLASALEAMIGAIYLDGGIESARKVIGKFWKTHLSLLNQEMGFDFDFKTQLQEIAQKELKDTPIYEVLSEEGPSHDRVFKVSVRVKNEILSTAEGRSKKGAEQAAAKIALETRFERKVCI